MDEKLINLAIEFMFHFPATLVFFSSCRVVAPEEEARGVSKRSFGALRGVTTPHLNNVANVKKVA